MKTQLRILSAALTLAFATAVSIASASAPGDVSRKSVDRYVTTLFTVKFDFERDSSWRVAHGEALAYVHGRTQTQLAADLKDVLARRGLGSPAGAGAAYLMVLHGIDAEANLQRLAAAHGHTSEAVEDSLPDALADIAIRLHSREAAQDLIGMRNGEYEAESQAMAIHRMFLAAPSLTAGVAAESPRLRKQLVELVTLGAWENPTSIASVKRVAAHLARSSAGEERAIYTEIAQLANYPGA